MKISQATPPPIPDKISYPFYDEPWWLDYSRWVRASKGWQCDECGISLKNNHEMVHTHHAKGINRHTLADLQANTPPRARTAGVRPVEATRKRDDCEDCQDWIMS